MTPMPEMTKSIIGLFRKKFTRPAMIMPTRPMNMKDPMLDRSLLVTVPYTAMAPNISPATRKAEVTDAAV